MATEDQTMIEQTKIEKIRQHLRDNKKMYLVGAGCLTAGYFLRPRVVNVIDVFNFKYKSPTTTTVLNVLERRACPDPIPVRDKLTGEPYGSINRAAKVTDVAYAAIREDVHGAQERFARLPDTVFA